MIIYPLICKLCNLCTAFFICISPLFGWVYCSDPSCSSYFFLLPFCFLRKSGRAGITAGAPAFYILGKNLNLLQLFSLPYNLHKPHLSALPTNQAVPLLSYRRTLQTGYLAQYR